jgi:uncharacterized protein
MSNTKHMGFEALDMFFALIKQALDGKVDGVHFFDMFTEDIIFEYPYAIFGTLPRIEGCAKLVAPFSG